MEVHSLTKIQLPLALLWAILGILALSNLGNSVKVLEFLSMVFAFAFSVITVNIGYLQVINKQTIINPFDVLAIRINKFLRGPIKSRKYAEMILATKRQMYMGIMNLISGLLCLLFSGLWFALYFLD